MIFVINSDVRLSGLKYPGVNLSFNKGEGGKEKFGETETFLTFGTLEYELRETFSIYRQKMGHSLNIAFIEGHIDIVLTLFTRSQRAELNGI